MKILKKINKGLLLTIIVLIVLIIYLVNVETRRNAEKPNIENTIKEYMSLINEYAVLPKDYQKIYGYSLTEDEKKQNEVEGFIKEHLKKFEEAIKEKTIDNETAIKIQKEMLESIISQKTNFINYVLIKYNKEIKKITKYEFDDDQVTVRFNSEVETETKYNDNGDEHNKLDTQKCEDESITLKFVDGKWKVVYVDLMIYNDMVNYGKYTIY